MKTLWSLLLLLSVSIGLRAETVTFEWGASSPSNEVAGYTIVWGTTSGNYTESQAFGNVLTGAVTTFSNNTRYFVSIYARSTLGAQDNSDLASELIVDIGTPPIYYTVTPSEGINAASGSIVPSTPQSVLGGQTQQFTVTADSGYQAVVGGTCTGALVGTTYTTNAINNDCGVVANYLASSCASVPSSGSPATYAFSTQTETFTYRASVIPSGINHFVFGHSSGAWSAYDSYATRVRFNTTGTVQVGTATAGGGGYSAAVTYNYSPGVLYDVRMVVNVTAKTYSVYIAAEGQGETTLASDYSFQSTQSGVSSLDRMVVVAESNNPSGAYICPTGLDEVDDTTPPSVTIATADPSNITADSLTVTGSASDAVGVSGCKWRRTSAPDAGNGTACTGTTSFACDTENYDQGANTLHVGCYDAAGNYGSDSITVNLDSIAPTVTSRVIPAAGTSFIMGFDEAVTFAGAVPTLSATNGAVTLSGCSAVSTEITCATSRVVGVGETVTASYTQPGDGIEDLFGNDLASFSAQAVTNNSTQDSTRPTVVSRVIGASGAVFVLTLDEAVTFAGAAPTLFGCSGGPTTLAYSSGSSSSALSFAISRQVLGAETDCQTSYVQPGDGIEDLAGNDLFSYSGRTATNESAQTLVALSRIVPARNARLARTITQASLGLTTDKAATCRWGTLPDLAWANLTEYATTGDLSHADTLPVEAGGVYRVCARCFDIAAEQYSGDTCASFSVTPKPKEPWWR